MYLKNKVTWAITSEYTWKGTHQIKIINEIAMCVGVFMRIVYPFVQTRDVAHRAE